jgi:hypothetical protein
LDATSQEDSPTQEGKEMISETDYPDWISIDKWNNLSGVEKQVERQADQLLSGSSKEFICNDTLLVWDCLEKGVMQDTDIVNYPQPENWGISECKSWCRGNGIEIESKVDELEQLDFIFMLHDVVTFGIEQIPFDVLRSILKLRLADEGEQGLALWRSVVSSRKPEIYEWWCIEEELADDLIELNAIVLKNHFGTWWGRQCTGQAIGMDGTLQSVIRLRSKRRSTG